ncbi:MAG: hypothetical protein J0665_05315 [Deltaproteobacteria bacterium]|nr:hypothetical protein [Deltaproteobacteria bacterium]
MKPATAGNSSSFKAKTSPKNKIAPEAEPKVFRTLKPEDMELEEWQTRLRRQFAEGQQFQLKNVGEHPKTFLMSHEALYIPRNHVTTKRFHI